MAELQHLPPDASPERIVAALDAEGACIVDDLATRTQMDALDAELAPYIEATPYGADGFLGDHTTRTGALIARSPTSRDLITHPSLLGASDLFLKRACDRYVVHVTQAIRIRPGQGKQPLHRDRLVWGGFIPKTVEPQLNTIWALTDFTKENGATQVVPGSNHWDDKRSALPEEIAYAEMKRGSALFFSGSVVHAGGANVSASSDRIGVYLSYCLGWLRTEENQYLSCPPHVARTLEPKLQELMGYALGSYALGYFSPPLPPGDGPEACPPIAALGAEAQGWGDASMAKAVAERVARA